MATELARTDVVVIGLGAVGGVAVLPLVNAGLNVIGLEAGGWITTRDFAPDEVTAKATAPANNAAAQATAIESLARTLNDGTAEQRGGGCRECRMERRRGRRRRSAPGWARSRAWPPAWVSQYPPPCRWRQTHRCRPTRPGLFPVEFHSQLLNRDPKKHLLQTLFPLYLF